MPSPLTKLINDTESRKFQHNVFGGLTRVTGPSVEPVSVADAKEFLRVDSTAEDSLILSLVTAARTHVEQYLQKSLITQTWRLVLDGFPSTGRLFLPMGPLQSVNSIKTYSSADAESVFSATEYFVDTVGDRVGQSLDSVWPANLRPTNAVIIDYTTGYGSAASDVPGDIVQAIKMLISHYYENRDGVVVGTGANELPMGVTALLMPYRRRRL